MGNYKAVFIDIDGTLFNDNKGISTITKDVIVKLKEMGVYVVLTSGRCSHQVKQISKEAGASQYIISSNGGEVYDYVNDTTIFRSTINPSTVEDVFNYCKDHDLHVFLNSKNKRYVTDINKVTEFDRLVSSYKEVDDLVTQIVVMGTNFNRMLAIKGLFMDHYKELINPYSSAALVKRVPSTEGVYVRDFLKQNISKSRGISELLDYLNILPSETISIGDNYNDLSMFDLTELSFAMGNAPKGVQERATRVTLSNNTNGVACALKEIFNID